MLARFFRHWWSAYGQARRLFPAAACDRITQAIGRAEQGHAGEICFVVEASLTPVQLLRHMNARQRAVEVFAQTRVWDTAHNSGVLIYLLLADRAVEIVADRGLHPRGDACAQQATELIRQAFLAGDAVAGCIDAVTLVGNFLRSEFPADGANPDELPNAVRIL